MATAILEKKETKKATEVRGTCSPSLALYEDADSYIALLGLPGADEGALQVRIERGALTVEAPLKVELPAGAKPRYSEMPVGDYRFSLRLGDQIDESKIEATFTAGMLKLTVPKSKSARARKVPIKTV